jgi:hypothetical protein
MAGKTTSLPRFILDISVFSLANPVGAFGDRYAKGRSVPEVVIPVTMFSGAFHHPGPAPRDLIEYGNLLFNALSVLGIVRPRELQGTTVPQHLTAEIVERARAVEGEFALDRCVSFNIACASVCHALLLFRVDFYQDKDARNIVAASTKHGVEALGLG